MEFRVAVETAEQSPVAFARGLQVNVFVEETP